MPESKAELVELFVDDSAIQVTTLPEFRLLSKILPFLCCMAFLLSGRKCSAMKMRCAVL